MLTPEQLEAAARKLCEIRGIDADLKHAFTEADVDGSGALHLTERTIAEWEYKAEQIRAYLEIQEAIQSVPQPSKPRIGICSCGHREDQHSVVRDSVGQVERCRECSCWIYLEDTGATIEANKQPRI